jgi:peptidoglycan hydrolase CwlO-like protein
MQELEHSNSLAKDRTDEVNALENKVRSLAQENDGLGRRLQEFGNTNKKIAEYDGKIALLSQEIERLNGVLRGKMEEVSSWESRCHNYEV